MSDEKFVLSQFQVGVIAALNVVGAALATLDPTKRQSVDDAIQKLLSCIPDDKNLPDGSSEGHLALKALQEGLLLDPTRK